MSKKWIKKGSEVYKDAPAESEEPITSPILLEPSTGPTYDKVLLLSLATAVKKAEVAASANDDDPRWSLTARPSETSEEVGPAERKQLRNAMKEAKQTRRSNSQLLVDPDEVGSISVNAPTTPGGSQMADPAVMAYLQSMTLAMHPMAAAYGANPAGCTTVMLRNIPNRYTREMLVTRIDKNYKGQYDFVYMPIDFKSTYNVGYVFINFRTPFSAASFLTEFHQAETRKVLPGFSSRKICEVSYARVQGLEANIENLRDEAFIQKLSERPECQPLFLSAKGQEIPFAEMMSIKRSGGKTPKGGVTPGSPGALGGFMMPMPYGPMMYPPMMPPSPQRMPSTSIRTVLPSATGQSMLMLRGVPPTCIRSEVIEMLNEQFAKVYDFLFLPPDATFERNKGFFFINFRISEKTEQFKKAFHEKKVTEIFPKFVPVDGDEEKTCSVESAKVELVENIIARTQTTPAAAKQGADGSRWQPLLFAPDGEPLTFPLIASAPGPPMGKTKSQGGRSPKAAAPAAGEGAAATPEAPAAAPVAAGAPEAAAGGPVPSEGAAPAAEPVEPKGKAKGKGEKAAKGTKGKEKGAKGKGKGAPPAYGAYPGAPYPFVGYPYGMHPYAAQAYTLQLQAHLQAQHRAASAAATANAAGAGGDPANLGPTEKKASLRKQVDFYFSVDNLCKDVYLRQQMDEDGYCKLDLIAGFNLVRKYKASIADIAEAIADSAALELDGDKKRVRLKDEAARQKWQTPPALKPQS